HGLPGRPLPPADTGAVVQGAWRVVARGDGGGGGGPDRGGPDRPAGAVRGGRDGRGSPRRRGESSEDSRQIPDEAPLTSPGAVKDRSACRLTRACHAVDWPGAWSFDDVLLCGCELRGRRHPAPGGGVLRRPGAAQGLAVAPA